MIARGWASLALGATASMAMAAFYVLVVLGASRSAEHLGDQLAADWYLVLPIVVGFGVQVSLMVELRRRKRLHGSVMASGTAGASASTVGMVACCAHHVADLLPIAGATAAATFLYDYRLAFMGVGVALNALAITVALRRVRQLPSHHPEVEHLCALDGSSP